MAKIIKVIIEVNKLGHQIEVYIYIYVLKMKLE
jgi:hypothetical protein